MINFIYKTYFCSFIGWSILHVVASMASALSEPQTENLLWFSVWCFGTRSRTHLVTFVVSVVTAPALPHTFHQFPHHSLLLCLKEPALFLLFSTQDDQSPPWWATRAQPRPSVRAMLLALTRGHLWPKVKTCRLPLEKEIRDRVYSPQRVITITSDCVVCVHMGDN